MIGVYDYTVILTYLSAISAGLGIMITFMGKGHPIGGCLLLLFCGLCDSFDGKVAATKKNRTKLEKGFGVQIDSLSDMIAFGVLPACIGNVLIRKSERLSGVFELCQHNWLIITAKVVMYTVLLLYILAALIRLAYYNVTEEERQEHESGGRKEYEGLPVTASALIFPFIVFLTHILKFDTALIYVFAAALTGVLFLVRFRVKKPGIKGVLLLVGVGAIEALLLIGWRIFNAR